MATAEMLSNHDLFDVGPLRLVEDAGGGPRLTASYRLDAPDVPEVLQEAAGLLRRELGEPFNAVGLNFYRDRNDSVAPHGDKLHHEHGIPKLREAVGERISLAFRVRPPRKER